MSFFEFVQTNAVAFYGVVAFISLMVGSFLNVVIHRVPIMMERGWRDGVVDYLSDQQSDKTQALDLEFRTELPPEPFNIATPRSRCPRCASDIKAWQNIPVLSYLLLAGKCAGCKTGISVRYPIVEFVTMLLSLVVAWKLGPTPAAVLGIVVTWFLISMSMIDFDHQLLPDSMTLPLMWIGLIAALFPVFVDLRSAVIGAAAGYLILWSIYQLFKLITGKEGMGYGDFKLLAALGALLGWQALPAIILLSSLVGAVVGLAIIAITRRDKNIPIPFGPYLAAAGWLAMLWGDDLTTWYYSLIA
ncbi:MAG: A24 family peptidase [Granulosicoccus sp.]